MNQYLSKFLYIMREEKGSLIILLLSILLTSLLEAIGIGLVGPFIALASSPNVIEQHTFLKQVYEQLNWISQKQFIALIGLVIVTIFYVKSVFNFQVRRYIFQFSLSHQGSLRLRLLQSYLTVPYTFHLKSNTAFLVHNIINETASFCNGILLQILNSTVNTVILCSLILLLLITDAVATLVISAMLLVTISLFYRFKLKITRWGKEVSEAQADMIRIVNHSLGGVKETRVIGCESYFGSQLKEQAERYADASSSFMTFNMLPRLTIEALMITFIVGLTSLSLLLDRGTENLISTLGVFAIVSIRLIPSVSQLTSGLSKIRNSSHALDILYHDLRELEKLNLDRTSTLLNAPGSANSFSIAPEEYKRCMSFHSQISLEQVFYRYPDVSETALKGISLTIAKGQSIALIGKSGAGKTTLVDVILGLLTPNSGDIKVDGISIYEDLRSWQNLIGYIPQSIFLTDDTIEKNVAFGVPEHLINPEKLNKALEAAQLTELVEQLPLGVKTSVGERGVCLSGGQRQRIGIARALYHGSEILILDEATSALDNETEGLVTEAIKSLSGTKTMIIIAHRLTTVEHCDRIYLMEKGRLVKSGSYKEVVLENFVPG